MSRRRRVLLSIMALAGWLALDHLPGTSSPAAAQAPGQTAGAGQLRAGAAKVEITSKKALPVNDPLYAKALVIKNDTATAVLITVDAVAIGEIGYIGNDYLGKAGRGRAVSGLGHGKKRLIRLMRVLSRGCPES
jgi:hypothetical protein